MNIRVLVEGASETALLERFLKRFQPAHHHVIIEHQGKGRLPRDILASPDPRRRGLLDQLPAKLRAFNEVLDPRTDRVLVLVDLDKDNCVELKQKISEVVSICAPDQQAMVRIAIEETEAFYLGDPQAMRKAYGGLKRTPLKRYKQDSVCGTWEVFQAVIGAQFQDKVGWAAAMGDYLSTATTGPLANRSPSFKQFCYALRRLAGEQWP